MMSAAVISSTSMPRPGGRPRNVAAKAVERPGDSRSRRELTYRHCWRNRPQPLLVLGNLSRDQLDRVGEVAMVARRWRKVFAAQSARSAQL